MATSELWGTDTPISMPEPVSSSQPILVDMGGFGFTQSGIAHNITRAGLEVYTTPSFLPSPALESDR